MQTILKPGNKLAQWLDDIETALAPTPPVFPQRLILTLKEMLVPNMLVPRTLMDRFDFIPTASNTGTVRTSTLLLSGLAVLTGIIGLVAGPFELGSAPSKD